MALSLLWPLEAPSVTYRHNLKPVVIVFGYGINKNGKMIAHGIGIKQRLSAKSLINATYFLRLINVVCRDYHGPVIECVLCIAS